MSASRDQSQKFTFVYQNLYQIYRQGKAAAKAAEVKAPETAKSESDDNRGIETAKIIKAEDLHANAQPFGVRVVKHEPPRLLGKRIESNQLNDAALHPARAQAIDGLRDNLKTLQGLHERLRFMLKELEELTKKSS